MATKPRSPNYPAFSLGKALEHARKVYAANHLHKAPRDVVAKAMGYTSLNGGSLGALSALKKYGLLDEDDGGMKITQDALTVLVEGQSSPERARTLVKLATKPELFAEIQAAFPGPSPNDELLRSWLLRKGFLQSTVDNPIRSYRETLELAESQKSLYTGPEKKGPPPPPPADKQSAEVGDLVQWEADGVLRMEKPRRVRATIENEGAWWVFVEESETGIPMDEVVVVERASLEQKREKAPPTLQVPPDRGNAPLPSEREWLRGTLSKDKGINYRLIVSGDFGSREIGKLIKLLEAQKLVLDDDDEL